MSNAATQDMTGLGTHVTLPEEPEWPKTYTVNGKTITIEDPGPEPARYYDWMLWKLRQDPDWVAMMSRDK